MKKTYLIPVLFVIQVSTSISFAAVTAKQFKRETKEHIFRVQNSAQILKREFPATFGHISKEQVTAYFSLHDLPKVQSIEELRPYGYTEKKTLSERLAKFHGKNFKDLAPAEAAELRSAIDDLTATENAMKAAFYEKYQWPAELISCLLLMERVADFTDVGIYRAKEMGIKEELYDGARFLLSKGEPEASEMSRHLENKLRGLTASTNHPSCSLILSP